MIICDRCHKPVEGEVEWMHVEDEDDIPYCPQCAALAEAGFWAAYDEAKERGDFDEDE